MTSPLPGKDPLLLPTPSLSSDEFEDFTERLLSAHKWCPEPLRRVVRVERWGRRGDKQDGIDFEGTFSDGTKGAWQCKRYVKLTAAQVEKFVKECTFEADEYYLVFSGEASPKVRLEVAKHAKWQLLDQRGLGRMLDDLPLHRQRQVLDRTWGVQKRQMLLQVSGEDALLPLENYVLSRRDPKNLLNDLGPLVGRDDEIEALRAAMDRSADWPLVVLVTGPGGRGKSRLITHGLEAFEKNNPAIPVLCLATGRQWDGDAIRELPHVPAVIWVDDAHRDPRSLTPLLNYARSTEGTQLVFASRGAGRDQVRSTLVEFGVGLDEIQEIVVGELKLGQARHLVRSLSDGMELSLELSEHLAHQALDSPHVAVLALNMARGGKLDGPLALDDGLREQILLRYQTLITEGVNAFESAVVLRTLAAIAALGPINLGDSSARSQLTNFCGLKTAEFLRLIERLQERGVIVTRSGLTRVTPDILADQVLEQESVVGGQDSGFVTELWETFGEICRMRLVVTLSELDWRLRHQGHSSVIAPVEAALQAEIEEATLEGLQDLLGKVESLSYTQPLLLINLLEGIQSRMLEEVETNASAGDSVQAEPTTTPSAAFLRPVTTSDIEHRLSKLYGQCAASAPVLLERALDALWALRRRDSRPTNPHTHHPERVITDVLASLGKLPDATFPSRIVARVDAWLAEPDQPGDATTAMFAFKPLLAKEGTRYVSTSRRQISIKPFLISPEWARSFRDSIRSSLTYQGSSADIHRASDAVHLLGDALRPPVGMHGQEISQDLIDRWEDDDLKTLTALTNIANGTSSSVVRRLVRDQIAWTSLYSRSMRLRHASLVLLTFLDQLDDDLAEALLGNFVGLQPSRRGLKAPTLDEVESAATKESEANSIRSEAERDLHRSTRISEVIATRNHEREDRMRRVAQALLEQSNVLAAITTIEKCCRDIEQTLPSTRPTPGLAALLKAMTTHRPDLAADLLRSITARPAGPLDEGLPVLIMAWQANDSAGLLAWLENLRSQRPEVRLAVASAFRDWGLANLNEAYGEVFLLGADDPHDHVRGRFLEGSHLLLRTDPVSTVEFLLRSSVSPTSASTTLQAAAEYDGLEWGKKLDEPAAEAVLKLVQRAGWSDYTVQQIAAGVAVNHPRVLLQHLMAYEEVHGLPHDIDGLPAALDTNPASMATWLKEQAKLPFSPKTLSVIGLAMSNGMSSPKAEALAAEIETVDDDTLINFVDLLGDVPIWPLSQPLLARRLYLRAEAQNHTTVRLREAVKDAMRLRFISSLNGVSEELNQALTAAMTLAENEPLDALRNDYAEAVQLLKEQEIAMRHRYEEDSA